jgi:hypothetical protein
MLQLRLITKETFGRFFADCEIPLQGEKRLSGHELNVMLKMALHISQTFHAFIQYALLNENLTCVQTNFGTQEEAYEMYESFVAGFCKQSVNN